MLHQVRPWLNMALIYRERYFFNFLFSNYLRMIKIQDWLSMQPGIPMINGFGGLLLEQELEKHYTNGGISK